MASFKTAFLQKVKPVKNCLNEGRTFGGFFKEKLMQNCLCWCIPSKATPVDK